MLAADPLAGTRYRALARLGAGAMGEVFVAENVALGNRVVVKLIRPDLASHPALVGGPRSGSVATLIDRMRLEAQTAARISHPNVVSVLDFATTDAGQPFYVMEFLHGRTLKEEVQRRGSLPAAEVLALAIQLLDGLAAVHDLGVVHRDLKPANLFLCDRPALPPLLKIIDFGIAKVTTQTPNAPAPLALPTAEGSMMGTPRFVSPEQALGHALGPTSDLYAVGLLLSWMLTGREPFHGHTDLMAVLKAHLNEPPAAPSSLNLAVPRYLDAIVLKALAKKPADRYASAREFAAALAARPPVAPIETEPMPTLAFRRPRS